MSKFLEDCLEWLKTQPFEIIRMAEAVGENEPETVECIESCRCINTYSVAKTFTMTAIGMLYDRGLLRLDERVTDILAPYVPESGMDERWRESTVEMALTHCLGLPGGFLDIDVYPISTFGRDFLRYMLTYPLAYAPGSESRYSDGAFYLLARIVEEKTGEGMDNFLWRELLYPLGFQEMAWSHCPMGHVMGATGLYIHAADMVRLGQLYLGGGVYRGRRYLSSEWVDLALKRGFGFDTAGSGEIYYKGGMYGQKLAILPRQNRVFALQAFGANSDAVAKWAMRY